MFESKSILYENTEKYIPPIKKGRVIKIYDGDTITIAAKLPNFYFWNKSPIYRFNIRLNGIDCPEIKSKNKTEKVFAYKVKKILSKMILDKDVNLKIIDCDKYGRLLADVYYDNINISNFLIENKMALSYNGGNKIHHHSLFNQLSIHSGS
jgi:micrococcal nuclease